MSEGSAEGPRRRRRRIPTKLLVPLCATLGICLPALFGLLVGIPEPVIQDEFSYLLGADTFARGRLSNPSPAFPKFFESPHILVTPTYQSKYPPAQALALAAGQRLFGHPIWGVWLSCGLYAGALVWMLQAWTSRHWALATSIISVLTLGTTTYWAQSYWGGMLGAAGAALLFGGLRRSLTAPTLRDSGIAGMGLVLLANARPFEGFLGAIPAAFVVARWFMVDRQHRLRKKLLFVAFPLTVVLSAGLIAMVIYNRALTGDPWRSPYQLHIDQYLYQGVFLFSAPRTPERKAPERVDNFYREVAARPLRGVDLVRGTVGRLLYGLRYR